MKTKGVAARKLQPLEFTWCGGRNIKELHLIDI